MSFLSPEYNIKLVQNQILEFRKYVCYIKYQQSIFNFLAELISMKPILYLLSAHYNPMYISLHWYKNYKLITWFNYRVCVPFHDHILGKPWIVLLFQNFCELLWFGFDVSRRDIINYKRYLVLDLWSWSLFMAKTKIKWMHIEVKLVTFKQLIKLT